MFKEPRVKMDLECSALEIIVGNVVGFADDG
jgi:hypothetical protein